MEEDTTFVRAMVALAVPILAGGILYATTPETEPDAHISAKLAASYLNACETLKGEPGRCACRLVHLDKLVEAGALAVDDVRDDAIALALGRGEGIASVEAQMGSCRAVRS